MRSLRRAVQIGSVVLALTGCMTWYDPKVAPATLIDQRRPDAVRVQRQDRSRVILYRPMISGDSLVGNLNRKKTTAIPLSDVSNVSIQRVNGGLTGLGILAFGAMVALAVAASSFTIL